MEVCCSLQVCGRAASDRPPPLLVCKQLACFAPRSANATFACNPTRMWAFSARTLTVFHRLVRARRSFGVAERVCCLEVGYAHRTGLRAAQGVPSVTKWNEGPARATHKLVGLMPCASTNLFAIGSRGCGFATLRLQPSLGGSTFKTMRCAQ